MFQYSPSFLNVKEKISFDLKCRKLKYIIIIKIATELLCGVLNFHIQTNLFRKWSSSSFYCSVDKVMSIYFWNGTLIDVWKVLFNKTIHVINNYIFAPKYYQESMETLFLFQKRNFIQETYIYILFCSECMLFGISDQISCSVVSDSLQPHELQHLSPPCPSPTPGVHSYSRPSSQWWHPAISCPVVPFSSCPQSLPASESFPMSQLFAWGGQSTRVSASASFPPKKSQGWSPSEWTGWSSFQSKGLSRVFSNTTVQKHQFFGAQASSQSNSHIHTWPQEKPQPWLDGHLLAK